MSVESEDGDPDERGGEGSKKGEWAGEEKKWGGMGY